ncbi:MAG: PQQ-dependent sugar dehydrogenase [Polyangiaceae bacterium]|nr:PQQ-dependent sugar dehydrogenase [Polyangiaceae bacterium]
MPQTRVTRSLLFYPAFVLALGVVVAWPCAASAQIEPGDPAAHLEAAVFMAGLDGPTDIAVLGDGRSVVVERGGAILLVGHKEGWLDKEAGKIVVRPEDTEQGLLGVVAHPDFAQNSTLYFYASVDSNAANKNKVLKGVLGIDGKVVVDVEHPVIDKGLEGPRNHNGGGLFIHKRQLYISVGDTGYNPEYNAPGSLAIPINKYASCLNKANGSILRINLDGSIPDDNPLVQEKVVTGCDRPNPPPNTPADKRFNKPFKDSRTPDKRIYAWGVRNGWRFWIDPKTDLLWIGDVGEFQEEEISVGGKGTHFGFPFMEGMHRYPERKGWRINDCTAMKPSRPCTLPVFSYPNRADRATKKGEDSVVVGGLIIDDERWPTGYRGHYFFGDFESGRIWTLAVSADRKSVDPASLRQIARVPYLSGFRLGPDGGLYVVSFGGNNVVRISPKVPVVPPPKPAVATPKVEEPVDRAGYAKEPSWGQKAFLALGGSALLALGLALWRRRTKR